MNRQRFSAIAHAEHVFCNPIGEETADRLLDRLELHAGNQVIDVGCGPAEMAIRLIERHGVRAVGVDPNSFFLERARQEASRRVPRGALELHQCAISDYVVPADRFDAALCVGASHAYGSCGQALPALIALVRPGGRLLMGEPYWKRPPDPEYLATFGGSAGECDTEDGNRARAVAAGLVPLEHSVASAEWEHYESLYAATVESWVHEHPGDAEAAEMIDHIHRWNGAFRKWGRDTMGFALDVYATPS